MAGISFFQTKDILLREKEMSGSGHIPCVTGVDRYEVFVTLCYEKPMASPVRLSLDHLFL